MSRAERRRVTNIHGGSLTENRSSVGDDSTKTQEFFENKRLAQPSQEYHFHSHGESKKLTLSNAMLTWEADFEKNLEHFIYPSLQISKEADIRLFQDDVNEKLHGHYNETGQQERLKDRRRSSVVDPKMLSQRHSMVSRLASTQGVKIKSHSALEREEKEHVMKDAKATAFEKELQAAGEQPINFDLFKEKALNWKVSVDEMPPQLKAQHDEEHSFIERTQKAEKHLKEKMRFDYEKRIVDKVKKAKNNKKEADVDGMPKLRQRQRAFVKNSAPGGFGHMFLSGDQLYESLMNDARNRRTRVDAATTLNGNKKELCSNNNGVQVYQTEHELIRDARKLLKSNPAVELESVASDGHDHLLDGLLYYRVRNELTSTENIQQRTSSANLPVQSKVVKALGYQRLKRTAFSEGDTSLKSSPASPNSLPFSSEKSKAIFTLEIPTVIQKNRASISTNLPPDVSPSLRSRVQRALSSIYNGYDKMEVLSRSKSISGAADTNVSLRNQRQDAQDKLLYGQLKLNKIPENLFRKGTTYENMLVLDFSYFGLGDELGLCLGKALESYKAITDINLRECRLTSQSLTGIIKSFSAKSLIMCDLSYNNMHGLGSKTLADFFYDEATCLHSLKMTHCSLKCSDVFAIAKGLVEHTYDEFKNMPTHQLVKWYLDNNMIKGSGAEAISHYLKGDKAQLEVLDLKWNELGVMGAEFIASALGCKKKNGLGCTLKECHLSCNGIGDTGAQVIAASVGKNTSLQVLTLTHNSVGGKACFIFSKVLYQHPTMQKLDISSNPLGEAGARCLFRIILNYQMKCFVLMKNCTFLFDASSFDSSNPASGSPYTLDTSDPYQAALLHELMNILVVEENHLHFDSLSVREKSEGGSKGVKSWGNEAIHNVMALDGKCVNKSNKLSFEPPVDALITVHCTQIKEKPSINSAVSKAALDLFIIIISSAGSDMDRKNWLQLICKDMYFTTEQADYMIRSFNDRMVHLSLLDIFENIWTKLLDAERKYDFLCKYLGAKDRHELINILTFEKFKFNWINATGHWYLDLANVKQRDIMVNMMALNNAERSFGREHSGRLDTSQKGNWNNFRNETYMSKSNEIILDEEFLKDKIKGAIEFDYVCTTRVKSKNEVKTITEEEILVLFHRLNLSKRIKLPRSKSIIALLELQVASCKYYFTVYDVIGLMNAFEEDDKTQSKLVTILFSRIYDLENFYLILREMSQKGADEVARCLGWLNIMNPMLPYHSFNLKLLYNDNRLLANLLLNLGASEAVDAIKELKGSEFLVIEAYASLSRLLSDPNPKILMFAFQQLNEKSCVPRWMDRKELMKHFLIGTMPIKKTVYNCIKWYREMESDGFLSRGPIDLQYKEYLKSEVKFQREAKAAKRAAKALAKSMEDNKKSEGGVDLTSTESYSIESFILDNTDENFNLDADNGSGGIYDNDADDNVSINTQDTGNSQFADNQRHVLSRVLHG